MPYEDVLKDIAQYRAVDSSFNQGYSREGLTFDAPINPFSVAVKAFEGFITGFTTIPVGEEPENEAEAIAQSIGHLLGFVGVVPGVGTVGNLTAKGLAGSMRLVRAGHLIDKSIPVLKGLQQFKSIPMMSADMILGGMKRVAGTTGAAKVVEQFIRTSPYGSVLTKAGSMMYGAQHLGIASATSSWTEGIDQMMESYVSGAVAGGVFRGLGEVFPQPKGGRLLGSSLMEKIKSNIQDPRGVARIFASSMFTGLASTANEEPFELQVYNYLLGAYFGVNEMSSSQHKIAKFLVNAPSETVKAPGLGIDAKLHRHMLGEPEKLAGWSKLSSIEQEEVIHQVRMDGIRAVNTTIGSDMIKVTESGIELNKVAYNALEKHYKQLQKDYADGKISKPEYEQAISKPFKDLSGAQLTKRLIDKISETRERTGVEPDPWDVLGEVQKEMAREVTEVVKLARLEEDQVKAMRSFMKEASTDEIASQFDSIQDVITERKLSPRILNPIRQLVDLSFKRENQTTPIELTPEKYATRAKEIVNLFADYGPKNEKEKLLEKRGESDRWEKFVGHYQKKYEVNIEEHPEEYSALRMTWMREKYWKKVPMQSLNLDTGALEDVTDKYQWKDEPYIARVLGEYLGNTDEVDNLKFSNIKEIKYTIKNKRGEPIGTKLGDLYRPQAEEGEVIYPSETREVVERDVEAISKALHKEGRAILFGIKDDSNLATVKYLIPGDTMKEKMEYARAYLKKLSETAETESKWDDFRIAMYDLVKISFGETKGKVIPKDLNKLLESLRPAQKMDFDERLSMNYVNNLMAIEIMNGFKPGEGLATMLADKNLKKFLMNPAKFNKRTSLMNNGFLPFELTGNYRGVKDFNVGIFETVDKDITLAKDIANLKEVNYDPSDKSKVKELLTKTHQDGFIMVRDDVYEAMMKSVGLYWNSASQKGTLVHRDPGMGMLLGKYAYHRASPELSEAMRKSKLDLYMNTESAKQFGLRETYKYQYNPEKKRFSFYDKDNVEVKYGEQELKKPEPEDLSKLTRVELYRRSKELGLTGLSKAKKAELIEKIGGVKSIAEDIAKTAPLPDLPWNKVPVSSFTYTEGGEGDKGVNRRISLRKQMMTVGDNVMFQNLRKHINDASTKAMEGDYLENTKYEEWLNKGDVDPETIDVTKLSLEKKLEIIYSGKDTKLFRNFMRDYLKEWAPDDELPFDASTQRNNKFMEEAYNAVKKLLTLWDTNNMTIFSRPLRKRVEMLLASRIRDEVLRPKVPALDVIMSPYGPDMMAKFPNFKEGEIILNEEHKGDVVEFGPKRKKVTLEQALKAYNRAVKAGASKELIENMENDLSFAGVRVPLSAPNGIRALKLVGFSGVKGKGAIFHPEDMKNMDGADLDIDKATLFKNLPKGVLSELFLVRNLQHGYYDPKTMKVRETGRETLPELNAKVASGELKSFFTSPKEDDRFIDKQAQKDPDLKNPYMVADYQTMTKINLYAYEGKNALGPGINTASNIEFLLDAPDGMIKGLKKKPNGAEEFRKVKTTLVNQAADASDGIPLITMPEIRMKLLESAFELTEEDFWTKTKDGTKKEKRLPKHADIVKQEKWIALSTLSKYARNRDANYMPISFDQSTRLARQAIQRNLENAMETANPFVKAMGRVAEINLDNYITEFGEFPGLGSNFAKTAMLFRRKMEGNKDLQRLVGRYFNQFHNNVRFAKAYKDALKTSKFAASEFLRELYSQDGFDMVTVALIEETAPKDWRTKVPYMEQIRDQVWKWKKDFTKRIKVRDEVAEGRMDIIKEADYELQKIKLNHGKDNSALIDAFALSSLYPQKYEGLGELVAEKRDIELQKKDNQIEGLEIAIKKIDDRGGSAEGDARSNLAKELKNKLQERELFKAGKGEEYDTLKGEATKEYMESNLNTWVYELPSVSAKVISRQGEIYTNIMQASNRKLSEAEIDNIANYVASPEIAPNIVYRDPLGYTREQRENYLLSKADTPEFKDLNPETKKQMKESLQIIEDYIVKNPQYIGQLDALFAGVQEGKQWLSAQKTLLAPKVATPADIIEVGNFLKELTTNKGKEFKLKWYHPIFYTPQRIGEKLITFDPTVTTKTAPVIKSFGAEKGAMREIVSFQSTMGALQNIHDITQSFERAAHQAIENRWVTSEQTILIKQLDEDFDGMGNKLWQIAVTRREKTVGNKTPGEIKKYEGKGYEPRSEEEVTKLWNEFVATGKFEDVTTADIVSKDEFANFLYHRDVLINSTLQMAPKLISKYGAKLDANKLLKEANAYALKHKELDREKSTMIYSDDWKRLKPEYEKILKDETKYSVPAFPNQKLTQREIVDKMQDMATKWSKEVDGIYMRNVEAEAKFLYDKYGRNRAGIWYNGYLNLKRVRSEVERLISNGDNIILGANLINRITHHIQLENISLNPLNALPYLLNRLNYQRMGEVPLEEGMSKQYVGDYKGNFKSFAEIKLIKEYQEWEAKGSLGKPQDHVAYMLDQYFKLIKDGTKERLRVGDIPVLGHRFRVLDDLKKRVAPGEINETGWMTYKDIEFQDSWYSRYFPHMNHDKSAGRQWVKDSITRMREEGKTAPEIAAMREESERESIEGNAGYNKDVHYYSEMMQEEIREDSIKRPNINAKHSLGRNREYPIPGWSKDLSVFRDYEKRMASFYWKSLGNFLSIQRLQSFEKSNAMGKATENWARFGYIYNRDQIGYPAVLNKEWMEDKEFGKVMKPYYFFTNNFAQDVADKIGMQKFSGKKLYKAIGDLITKEEFDKLTLQEKRQLRDLVDAGLDRKLMALSSLEAKWSLISLLTHTKTMVNNLLGGHALTFASVGARDFLKASDLTYIRERVLPGLEIKSMNDVVKFMEEAGGLEMMYKVEAELAGLNKNTNLKNFFEEAATMIKGGGLKEQSLRDLAKKHKISDRFFETAGWFMRWSEIKLRKQAWLAHYIKAKETLDVLGMNLEYNHPWLIQMANKGVAGTQFLYNQANRPAFIRTPLGKIFGRFQLWAWNSLKFRKDVLTQLDAVGYRPGTVEAKRVQRIMTADLFMFALASVFPGSMFESNLAPPMSYLEDLSAFFFGDKKEKERAFYSVLPYPLGPIQMISPPSARVLYNTFSLAINGDLEDYSRKVMSWLPYGRLMQSTVRTVQSPKMAVENFVGLPIHRIAGWKDKLGEKKKTVYSPSTLF